MLGLIRELELDRPVLVGYQPFHRLPLSHELVDGDADAVRAYLGHFWALERARLEPARRPLRRAGRAVRAAGRVRGQHRLVPRRLRGGRAVGGRAAARRADRRAHGRPVGEHEPLFPVAWSDRIGAWYSDIELHVLEGVGHFAPAEAPAAVAEATVRALRR